MLSRSRHSNSGVRGNVPLKVHSQANSTGYSTSSPVTHASSGYRLTDNSTQQHNSILRNNSYNDALNSFADNSAHNTIRRKQQLSERTIRHQESTVEAVIREPVTLPPASNIHSDMPPGYLFSVSTSKVCKRNLILIHTFHV